MLVLARFGRAAAWLGGIAAAAIPSSRMAGHYARIDHHVLEPAAALGLYALVFARPPRRRVLAGLVAGAVGLACAFTLDLTFVFLAILGALAVAFALARRPLPVDAPAVLGIAAGVALATVGDAALGAPRALGVDLRLAVAVAFAAAMLARRDGPRAAWIVLAAAVLFAAVRGASLGLWLTAPADSVTRTMDEALPGWTQRDAAAGRVPPVAHARRRRRPRRSTSSAAICASSASWPGSCCSTWRSRSTRRCARSSRRAAGRSCPRSSCASCPRA